MIHYNTIRDPYLIVLIRGLAEFPHAQSGSKRGSRELHLRFRSFHGVIVAILSHRYGQFITLPRNNDTTRIPERENQTGGTRFDLFSPFPAFLDLTLPYITAVLNYLARQVCICLHFRPHHYFSSCLDGNALAWVKLCSYHYCS